MPTKKTKKSDERLMTLAELSSYLHLGRRTVLRLVTSSTLPGVLLGKEWRFKPSAINTWLEGKLDHAIEDLENVPDGARVPLGDLLPLEGIIDDMRAQDALTAIEELAARAYQNRWLVDKPWFIGAVVERETLASTAMEGGVAFLHTRARDAGKIERPFIICGRSYAGIDFGAPDGKKTYLLFLLGLQYDKLHLPILGRLARAMRDPKAIARLRAQPSTSKIRALLLKEDAASLTSKKTERAVFRELSPEMDRKHRIRAIMRRDAIRKHKEQKADEAEEQAFKAAAKAEKKAAEQAKKKAVQVEKKRLAAEKKRLAAEKRQAAAAKKAAARAKQAAAKKAAAAKAKAKAKANKAAAKAKANKAAAKAKANKAAANKKTFAKKRVPTTKRAVAKKKPSTKKPTAKKKSTANKKSPAKKSPAKKSASTVKRASKR